MIEQIYTLKNPKSFELKDIFDCGQCFRWNKNDDGSYTGVIKNGVLNVKCNKSKIYFNGILNEDIRKIVNDYFDLNRDYTKIKQELSKIDEYMENSINYGKGIRILNQDLWETIISFIVSSNNNIPRIKGIIERISQKYGNEILYNNKKYYTFPTPKQLSNASVDELRKIGLGFRDKRVFETTQIVLNRKIELAEIQKEKDIAKIKNELLKLPGVGPKVADCIMLFSMKKKQVFPIDVWIRRVMNNLYINKEDEKKVHNEEILKIANKKYGELAGIAQQYLFYWIRETKTK